MKILKNGNLPKLVAFFVIAVVLTCTVAFAASGWQSFIDEPDSGNADGNNNGDSDENKDGENNLITGDNNKPKYTHYLTGIEIEADDTFKRPLCFAFDTDAPLYGISSSILTIEIQTEDSTRILSFTDDHTTLGKIGSIAPTRKYISEIANLFGGILIHRDNDDKIDYASSSNGVSADLLSTSGYFYTEYSSYYYSNGDLISALIKNTEISTVRTDASPAPFIFKDNYVTANVQNAERINISYSDSCTSELIYDKTTDKYSWSKNSLAVKDLLNDKACFFDNVFVLFADSTTYETADYTEAVLSITSGMGYYMSSGKMQQITWSVDESGALSFNDVSGNPLYTDIGRSYISFIKSSRLEETTLS